MHQSPLVPLLAVVLLVLACGSAPRVEVPIAAVGGSAVTGRATLTSSGPGTTVALDLAGLTANAPYRVQLHAGSCEQPSASATRVADVLATANGTASLSVPVRYRDTADMDLRSVADGTRILAVQLLGIGMVACGAVGAVS